MNKKFTRRRFYNLFMTIMGLTYITSIPLRAQFSPGELTRAHQKLDGLQNCTQCHEFGNKISGEKCLACHGEISRSITAQHGFHFSNSTKTCVTCHKEHLGRNMRTMQFNERAFDHSATGFALTGKHRLTSCKRCHLASKITDVRIRQSLVVFPRSTYLGITSTCNSCHADPHKNQFGQNCATCHSTTAFSPVQNFDHSKTKFQLEGKHLKVSCSKCHPGITSQSKTGHVDFKTQTFTDCRPCHKVPHVSSMHDQTCRTCHSYEGFFLAMNKPFDHEMTRFRLVGKHTAVHCDKCHRLEKRAGFANTFLLSSKQCIDCHADKHNGEFLKTYKNDCMSCHTVDGFRPSSFTLARHNKSPFSLTGAHVATICASCHRTAETATPVFHFRSTRCDLCHKDPHKGQFDDQMKVQSCGHCHATSSWKTGSFDHSTTTFPLIGKHAVIACLKCHADEQGDSTKPVTHFKKVSKNCESCHRDNHRNQFAVGGTTRCGVCHQSASFHSLIFNHETQSSFSLKGGHQKVACAFCHKEERIGTSAFVRYKPLRKNCESCHQRGTIK